MQLIKATGRRENGMGVFFALVGSLLCYALATARASIAFNTLRFTSDFISSEGSTSDSACAICLERCMSLRKVLNNQRSNGALAIARASIAFNTLHTAFTARIKSLP